MTRKAFYETPEKLEAAIEAHRAECTKKKEPVTLTGMLLALGFKSKRSFYYQADRTDNESEDGPTWKEVIEYGMLLFEHEHEKGLHKGGNCGGHIFGLRNAGRKDDVDKWNIQDGWNDRHLFEHTGKGGGPITTQDTTAMDAEERLRKVDQLLTRVEKRAKAADKSREDQKKA